MKSGPVLRATLSLCLATAFGGVRVHAADAPHGLTPELKKQFLSDAETNLRGCARVTPTFWDWLAKHPQIRAGLLSAADPVPAAFAENLDSLRLALGPEKADRYANLLLGVSLGEKLTGGSDGAYLATAVSSSGSEGADSRVKQVVDYLKQKNLALVDFATNSETIFREAGVTSPPGKAERGAFINSVAFATGTYPPHRTLPLAESLRKMIAHHETKLPPFTDKGPQWPLFPLDTAPWPLLAPMRQTISDREMDYLWERFQGKLESGGKRLVTYSRYTFDYEKPEIRYKKSEWYPTSIPRIIEDGGVCGRQSTMAQLSQVGLGRPAVGMGQPGHRALLSYRYDAKDGHYSAVREQSITSPDKSSCQWYLPASPGPRVHGGGRSVGVEYHVALALAMNIGLDRYTDSRIACQLALRKTGGDRQELLESAVNLNSFNLDAWYALAKLAGPDTAAANQLLARLDALMAAPDSGLAEETELAADTDLSRQTAQSADSRRDANLVAAQTGESIVEMTYGAAFADKEKLARNRANLRAEVVRRAQLKIPHGAAVQSLVLRYDMAAEGPAKTQAAVAAQVKNLFNEKPARRKSLAENAKQNVGIVLSALPKPTERVTWLSGLREIYPADVRFQVGKNGKAAAEPLYAFLNDNLLKSLKATGKAGAAESKRIASEIEAARLDFESKAKKG